MGGERWWDRCVLEEVRGSKEEGDGMDRGGLGR